MCDIADAFFAYTTAQDWQAGFATAQVFPDGTFHPELASWVKGTLRWRGKQYR